MITKTQTSGNGGLRFFGGKVLNLQRNLLNRIGKSVYFVYIYSLFCKNFGYVFFGHLIDFLLKL